MIWLSFNVPHGFYIHISWASAIRIGKSRSWMILTIWPPEHASLGFLIPWQFQCDSCLLTRVHIPSKSLKNKLPVFLWPSLRGVQCSSTLSHSQGEAINGYTFWEMWFLGRSHLDNGGSTLTKYMTKQDKQARGYDKAENKVVKTSLKFPG